MRRISGVSDSNGALAIEAEWEGIKIRVLEPISLFASKLELAIKVSQHERRDIEHLKILVLCVRAFLREFLDGVACGDLPSRGWLGAVNRVLKLTGTVRARRASVQFGVSWFGILPHDRIAVSKDEKIIEFRKKRLPRWKPF